MLSRFRLLTEQSGARLMVLSGVKLEVTQSPSSEPRVLIAIGEVVLYAAQQFSRPGNILRS